MIRIHINPESFEYDIRALVSSFYPGEEIAVNDAKLKRPGTGFFSVSGNKKLDIDITKGRLLIIWKTKDVRQQSELSVAGLKRADIKNLIKREVYRILEESTGHGLSWGTLTGIRPVKIASGMLSEGKTPGQVKEALRDGYYISDAKADLCIEIAQREKRVLSDVPYREGYSLYVGIPFCPTKCLYCSFTSYPEDGYKVLVEPYLDALFKEIRRVSALLEGKKLNTVYIGGGTPTMLSADQIRLLLDRLKSEFDFSDVREFTVEAGRPDSITREKLTVLFKEGVDRICVNPQTMNRETLELIGRRHTPGQTAAAFYAAREAGFKNINMDIIAGLPGEDGQMFLRTLSAVCELCPDALTVHSLALKRAARLNIEKEKYQPFEIKNNEEMMNLADAAVRSMNMAPYYLYRQKNMAGNQENSGYAKEGFECLYNILMMGDYQNIIALGAGASTKMMTEDRAKTARVENVKNVETYIARVDDMIRRKEEYIALHGFYEKEAGRS